jgi:hypothetical protein
MAVVATHARVRRTFASFDARLAIGIGLLALALGLEQREALAGRFGARHRALVRPGLGGARDVAARHRGRCYASAAPCSS